MQRQRKLLVAKMGMVLAAIPILIWAHEYGPDAGVAGVPNENGTCNQASCHLGPPAVNAGGGSVKVDFPGAMTYTPGVKQHLVVTIADPTQRAWGFEITARPASNSATMAGAFFSTDANTQRMCASANLFSEQEVRFSAGTPQTCPASMPLHYMEHSLAGYNATRGHTASQTYDFDWMPPDTDVGPVTIYVAGNAANGDLTERGDHIYSATYTLNPAAAAGPPSIRSSAGVQSAGAFGAFSSIAPGTWMEIYGSNLSANTRSWAGADFNGTTAPTSLDGTSVSIGGKAAFVDYISPTQVNAQVPAGVAAGPQSVVVTTPAGSSSGYTITVNALQPGLLAPTTNFLIGGKQYVVAQFADQSFVLPAGAISGLNTRPAKPNETVVIYGIGFGPVVNGSNQDIPPGQIVTASNQLVNPVQMQVNGVPATLTYAGLAPNFVGLYQFNLVVPAVPDGDQPLTFTQNGVKGSQTLLLSVHQ